MPSPLHGLALTGKAVLFALPALHRPLALIWLALSAIRYSPDDKASD